MGKLLRIALILALPLSIAAVVLEFVMFRQRYELQQRRSKLQQSLVRISQKATAAREPYVESLGSALTPDAIAQTDLMRQPLDALRSNVVARLDQLHETRDTLKKTRDELTATQQELARTRQELDSARQEIASLNETIAQKDAQIASAKQKISELEGQIGELSAQVQEQQKQIAKLEADQKGLKEEKQRLEDALAPFLPPPMLSREVAKALRGSVVLVDPEWRFVILDVGKVHGLQKNATLLVHRGEQLIGRLRVTDVRDNLSVADLDREWMTAEVQPGDRVFIQ